MNIFMTGGTGFVGCSVLERFEAVAPRSTLTVLTRDPNGFSERMPALARRPWLTLVEGDVLTLRPDIGRFDAIIHAATSSDAKQNASDPQGLIETVIIGTRNALALAERCGNVPILLASSGAVYGAQPPGLNRMPESYIGQLDHLDIANVYAESKRAAELECVLAAKRGVPAKIVRMFAFVGPHLPLRRHFAIGNFIADALEGKAITIKGDGTAVRSYLHADDMVDWLWAVLMRGIPGRPYNVGSERALSIADLARLVAATSPRRVDVEVLGRASPMLRSNRYVPDTGRIRSELGSRETIRLEKAISMLMRGQSRV